MKSERLRHWAVDCGICEEDGGIRTVKVHHFTHDGYNPKKVRGEYFRYQKGYDYSYTVDFNSTGAYKIIDLDVWKHLGDRDEDLIDELCRSSIDSSMRLPRYIEDRLKEVASSLTWKQENASL